MIETGFKSLSASNEILMSRNASECDFFFSDVPTLLADTLRSYNEADIPLKSWLYKQSPFAVITFICTFFGCFLDQRAASYIAKKYGLKVNPMLKVYFATKIKFS